MARRTVRSGVDTGGPGAEMRAGLSAVYKALLLVRSIKIVLPLLLYFLFELIVILLYARGGPGPLDGLWGLVLPGRGAEALGHYPQRLLLLPVIMGRFGIVFDILLHVVAQGVTVLLIASALEGKPLDLARSFGRTVNRYPHLAGAMLAATAVILAVTYLPALPSILGRTAGNRLFMTGGGIVLGILAQAFFLYVVPFVLLGGETLFGAVGRSIRFACRRYLLSLTIAAVSFVVTLPTFLLEFKAQIISLRIFPELIVHMQILGEIMKLVSTFILVGGVTVVYFEKSPPVPDREGTKKKHEQEGGR